ncbi:MAG: DUF domain-containing protein [Polynucleobacter sp.]|nr:DUF domain-containing protein [Polynucleobacter sp.]
MGGTLFIKKNYFTTKRQKHTAGGKEAYEFQCFKCELWVANHPERMYNHLFVNCEKLTIEERLQLRESLPDYEANRYVPVRFRKRERSDGTSTGSELQSATESNNIEVLMKDSTARIKAREERLCNLIVALNWSFNVFDHPEFRQFFKDEFNYTPPSATTIHRRILPAAIQDVRQAIREKLANAQHITLSTDSWTNQRNESITNFVAICEGTPVFFAAVHSIMQIKDSEYYAQLTEQVIADAGIASRLVGVVTDNASVMRRMWDRLQQKYPDTTFVGCHAHGLNLFINDVFSRITVPPVDQRFGILTVPVSVDDEDELEDVGGVDDDVDDTMEAEPASSGRKKVPSFRSLKWNTIVIGEYTLPQIAFIALKLTVFFRKYQMAGDAIRIKQQEGGLRSLQMPGATRWGSVVRCISRVYENRDAIVSVIRDCGQVRQKLKVVVLKLIIDNDDTIWTLMKTAIDALTPLCSLLTVIEGDACTVSTAFHHLQEYGEFLATTELARQFPEVLLYFNKRREFLYNPRIAAAYAVDTRYAEGAVQNVVYGDVVTYFASLEQDLFVPYSQFLTDVSKRFDRHPAAHRTFLTLKGDPLLFWKRIPFLLPEYESLAKVATRLLSVVCNSASSERVWSDFSFIHSKIRNKLSTEKTINLAIAYAWKHPARKPQLVNFNMAQFSIHNELDVMDVGPDGTFVPPLDEDMDEEAVSEGHDGMGTCFGAYASTQWTEDAISIPSSTPTVPHASSSSGLTMDVSH